MAWARRRCRTATIFFFALAVAMANPAQRKGALLSEAGISSLALVWLSSPSGYQIR